MGFVKVGGQVKPEDIISVQLPEEPHENSSGSKGRGWPIGAASDLIASVGDGANRLHFVFFFKPDA